MKLYFGALFFHKVGKLFLFFSKNFFTKIVQKLCSF
nr:MAG TPA: hypothetical protein [Caudoviricetes sp.]